MRNVNTVIDQFESLYPGCQLLLTYDNALSHVAKKKGALSTTLMNKSDGGKQPILIQMGWYDKYDPTTGTTIRMQPQMWYPGADGSPVAKGALTICMERDLVVNKHMRRDERRARPFLLPNQTSVVLSQNYKKKLNAVAISFCLAPNAHPECMHIELCWAHVKRYCRQHCGRNIMALRTNLEYALSSEYLTTKIHTDFSNHAWKWIEAYSNEMDLWFMRH